ncbi:MAG: DUF3141 domain-containing protein [Desulfobacteraceae bacterium]|nr:DUF3141 domain-containing protein [Desulfobacteraceae bacterium]
MNTSQQLPGTGLIKDMSDYCLDTAQRSVLFMDILRKRGNIYLEHLEKGQPPVLTFDYEIILDGRGLDRPVNHDLARIVPKQGITVDPGKRPIVIIDPRAGHGPGIGGSKRDSEIGMAMNQGHPVYFILFYPDPCPGQTLADVEQAQIYFIKEIARRHSGADEPAVIGNCQAGWAVALLSADRPDITGPIVLNGSPLSYWSGMEGENPMRYKGGLLGGIWLTSLLSDLGNGIFDGANLVANFESLNPANTYWTKQYNVWSKADTEEERYLEFEKWWNGYFTMTSEEIHFIVSNLFVGNKLEQGKLEISKGKKIDLKNLEDPILVFASKGDNITPPQQALNWIASVYGSVDELKRLQQTVIYMVHEKIGHLGIFVSGSIAKKEHKEIIETIDMIDYLPPGLYEMVIEEIDSKPIPGGLKDYNTKFVERDMKDIMMLDDGRQDEEDFCSVAYVSEMNDRFYQTYISPLVKMSATDFSAELLRQLHPMRVSRYSFSDMNPFLFPFRQLAPVVKQNRRQVAPDNIFLAMEKTMSDGIITMLNCYRDIRDDATEYMFKSIYGNPMMKSLFPETQKEKMCPSEIKEQEKKTEEKNQADKEKWLNAMEQGGFAEGIVRIMVALADADQIIDQREYAVAEKIVMGSKRLRRVRTSEMKQMVKDQARILETDEEKALNALASLLPTPEERNEAMEIARNIACADLTLRDEEKVLIEKIEKALELENQKIEEYA